MKDGINSFFFHKDGMVLLKPIYMHKYKIKLK